MLSFVFLSRPSLPCASFLLEYFSILRCGHREEKAAVEACLTRERAEVTALAAEKE